MKLKTFFLASAAAMVSAAGAQADTYKGLYGAIGAGLNEVQEDRDFETPNIGGSVLPQLDSELDYDNGIGVYSALGYAWGNSWRTELEFSYRDNDARHIAPDLINGQPAGFSGFPESTLNGSVSSYSFLLNAIRDLDFLSQNSNVPITPYVGAGVGVSFVELNLNGANPVAINGISPISVDDTRSLLAFQGIAGVAIDIAENLALDLSYRYYGTAKRGFEGSIAGVATDIITTPNSHSLFAGLRWNFGAAPAAVAAAAPLAYKDCWDGSSVPVTSSCPVEIEEEVAETPDPIQTTVYFDFDKSNLTSEAAALIREAVRRANGFDVEQVRVVGNTDTSGSSAYNQALSERRARVVRDALIAEGIPAGIISSNAAGETNLAKATPDGTREPLIFVD